MDNSRVGRTTITVIASILHLAQNVGYPALVLLILAESAGIPLPGETALITAAALAGQHKLQLPLVIVLAATAAIIGDNLGYLVARKGGRWLLQRPGPFARQRARVLKTGEPFFQRHGPKAVFLARWILGLRTWASWLAGASKMPWRAFLIWNAAGAITWATTIAVIAYYAGHSTAATAALFTVAGLTSALAIPSALIARRKRRQTTDPQARTPEPARPPVSDRAPARSQTRRPARPSHTRPQRNLSSRPWTTGAQPKRTLTRGARYGAGGATRGSRPPDVH